MTWMFHRQFLSTVYPTSVVLLESSTRGISPLPLSAASSRRRCLSRVVRGLQHRLYRNIGTYVCMDGWMYVSMYVSMYLSIHVCMYPSIGPRLD